MFGLELLARAQGRSLSQAVEWALQLGLNNFPCNDKGDTVADAMEKAWREPHPLDRLRVLNQLNPGLMSFEDRGALEFLDGSFEWQLAETDMGAHHFRKFEESEWKAAISGIRSRRQMIVLEYARAFWDEISRVGAERYSEGSLVSGFSIIALGVLALGLGDEVRRALGKLDEFAIMQALTEAKAADNGGGVLARAHQLDKEMIWSLRYQS